MPKADGLLNWLNRCAPRENPADLPEFLSRVADALESRGANLGLKPGQFGVSISDAIVLTGVQTHRFALDLLDAACDALTAEAGSAEAAQRMDTERVVAVLRGDVQRRCMTAGRSLGSTDE